MKLFFAAPPPHILRAFEARAPTSVETPSTADVASAGAHDVVVSWLVDDDGLAWLSQVAAARRHLAPRLVVVCTALGVERALGAGADDVLTNDEEDALAVRLRVAAAALCRVPDGTTPSQPASATELLLERLERSEELTRSILEAMPGGVVHVALDGSVVRANAEAARVLGLRVDQLTQRYIYDFATRTLDERGEPCPVDEYPVTRALVSGEPQPRKTIGVQRADGSTSWAVFTAVPVKDPHTLTTTGAVVTFLDITERLAAERTLAESEERYRQVAEKSPDAMGVVQSGRLVYVNEAAVRLLGYDDAPSLVGIDIWTLIPADHKDAFNEAVRARVRGEVHDLMEERLLRRDGQSVDVEISVASLEYRGERALSFVARDISGRKRDEEELERLRAQVTHGQKLESLGLLAGGVAHDFNNLLAAILGNASLAKIRLPADSPAAGNVAAIETAARRAADLTGQMLAYAGRGTVVVERVALSQLVSEMVDLLSTVISKKATLDVELDEELPAVEGDAAQLRQVVMNLILNASDALREGVGRITIKTGTVELTEQALAATYVDDELPAGRYVVVEISDTGIGMDEATRARVFDPFFSTKTTGRGLGLAATLGIVRGHGGAIELRSEPNRGTTFRVYFPVSEARRPRSEPPEGTQPRLRGALVLVVDDEPMVREVSATMLREFGYDTLEAGSGRAALAQFARHAERIDVVLLDMTMPDLSGSEVLTELRAMHPEVRVVLCSGYTKDDIGEHVATEHVAAFLQKPFNASALVRAIERALDV